MQPEVYPVVRVSASTGTSDSPVDCPRIADMTESSEIDLAKASMVRLKESICDYKWVSGRVYVFMCSGEGLQVVGSDDSMSRGVARESTDDADLPAHHGHFLYSTCLCDIPHGFIRIDNCHARHTLGNAHGGAQ